MKLTRLNNPRLFCNTDMIDCNVEAFLGGTVVSFSHRAPHKDRLNEDAMAVIPFDDECGVIVVADGLGGAPEGDKASCIAVQTLAETVSGAAGPDHLRNEILNGIELANQRIRVNTNGGATTLCVVEIQGATIRPYHVGDSMIVVTGQRGKIKLRTVPHSPVSYAVESGMLDENQAVSHPDLHYVSNMLGSEQMHIDVGSRLNLNKLDTLIVVSDGVSDNFYVEDLADQVRVGNLKRKSALLVQQCLHRMTHGHGDIPGKEDDYTFVLYRRSG